MSEVWFTSDLHIGHAKVASIRATEQGITRLFVRNGDSFTPDPEHDIRWHDQSLAIWWDDMVGRDDVVHILGDISAGGDKAQRNAIEWLRKRPGRKRLKLGNHDGPHDMYRDSAKWLKIYQESEVFDDIRLHGRMRIPLSDGHTEALLSHFPYRGDRGPDRHTQWRLPNEGTYILHGHTHSSMKRTYVPAPEGSLATKTVQIHVGVDAWDMKPVSLPEISALVEPIEEFLA